MNHLPPDIIRAFASLHVKPDVCTVFGRRAWCATSEGSVALIVKGYGAADHLPNDRLSLVMKTRMAIEETGQYEWTRAEMRRLLMLWPWTPSGGRRSENAIPQGLNVRMKMKGMVVCMRLPIIKKLERMCLALRERSVIIERASENKGMLVRIRPDVFMTLMPAMQMDDTKYLATANLIPA